MPATTPADRQRLLARAIADHRSREDGVVVSASGDGATARLTYADRVVTLDLDDASDPDTARAALADLLDGFPVFKIAQPETRKAANGTVHVSALADPKHCADFIESCCREVFGFDEGYELTVEAGTEDG
jgi:hypothetical protein